MRAEGQEEPLVGGCETPGVVRVGRTVRRPLGPRAAFVHAVLRHLEAVGFEGAPRLLGVDERGREILTFISGEVGHAEDAPPVSEARLKSAAVLMRRLHDLTAGTPLALGGEVVAHHDLGPHNTVFAGDAAVAFIDWDGAAPGSRRFDLATAIWSFVPVGEGNGPIALQARRLRLMCDAYGWQDTNAVVDEIAAELARALSNHESARREHAADIFRAMLGWMTRHADALKANAAQEASG